MPTVRRGLSGEADVALLDEVHALLDDVWAAAPHVDQGMRGRFALATAELVANVLEHGSGGKAPAVAVELVVEVDGDVVRGTLLDTGHLPPRDAARRGLAVPLNLTDLSESGWGLPLLRTSTDELDLTHDGTWNRWSYAVHPR